jgi:tetratricopeptide (TPR) repeat protein
MKRRELLISLLLAGAAFALFLPVGGNEFLAYDDHVYVVDNPALSAGLTPAGISWAFTTFHASNWHPLTWLSHMLDVQLFGLDPRGHHLMNAGIHAAAAALLFLALAGTTGAVPASAVTAAFFAVHPLHVQTVAWVAERKDVLSGLCWMLVLLMYLHYVRKPSPARYVSLVALYIFGLMAKPMLVSLPLILLLLDWWPLGRISENRTPARAGKSLHSGAFRKMRRCLFEKVPLLGLALVSSVLTWQAQSASGAIVAVQEYPYGLRLANALVSYLSYIVKMLWPHRLAVFYPMPLDGIAPGKVAAAVIALAMVTTLALRFVRRFPWAAMGWGWYVVTLVPVIGLVQVGNQGMADRYTYLPLIGLFMAAVWGGMQLAKQLPRVKRAVALVTAAMLVSCVVATRGELSYWNNGIALFTRALEVTPDNAIARLNLAQAYLDKGMLQDAVPHLEQAVTLLPTFKDALNDLGTTLSRLGKRQEAIGLFQRAIAVDPGYVNAYMNLGMAYVSTRNRAGAQATFLSLQNVDPAAAAQLQRFIR